MAALPRIRKNPNEPYEKLRTAAEDARKPYDKDAYLNIAYYLDEQYVEWRDDVASIRTVARAGPEKDYPRPVVNKIMPAVTKDHAFVLQSKPVADVLPATDDLMDITDAEISTAYVNYVQEPQVTNFPRVLSDAVLWALVANEAYLKWVWNPRTKKPEIAFVPSTDLALDPYARQFGRARYAVHSQFMDVEQVYDVFGKEVHPSKIEKQDLMRTELLRDMGQAPAIHGVTVHELWHLPSRRHPKGIYTVWTGRDVLVEKRDFPYRHMRLPFTQIGSIPRPNSIHYSSPVKYQRSPQTEINLYHAQRILFRKNFANGKWYIPADLDLNEDPNDAPNQILRASGGAPGEAPQFIQPAVFPDQTDGQWLNDEMMNLAGQHEVSQGQAPGRVESASALELLKVADDSRLKEVFDTVTGSISEGFWMILQLAHQYESTEVIVQTYSREGFPEVRRFKASTVKPGMRLRVTSTTGLAKSRSARAEQLLLLWQNRIIQDPEEMSRLLDIPVTGMISTKVYDIRLARNENLLLAKGKPIVPNSWDDHAIHIREHNNYRKTTEFLTSPLATKEKYEHHVSTHTQFFAQQLEDAARAQAAMNPEGAKPGEKGKGEQPSPEGEPTGPPETPATGGPEA